MTLVIKNKEDQEDSDTVVIAPEDNIASTILAEANDYNTCDVQDVVIEIGDDEEILEDSDNPEDQQTLLNVPEEESNNISNKV